jgi:tetratricopeptide (TPR) repeat protein
MEEDYFKSLYRLQGLEEKIQVPNFEAFLNNLVNEVIKNPVYLDQEMKNFVKKFIPKNILVKINDIISDNKIYLSENNFVSAYTLLNFLNNNHVINSENLTTLKKLESYFSLKSELTDMNNKVYFLEKAEMETFVQEIYQVGEKLVQMTLENDLLKNLYLSSIKTMNNKIYTIDENIISDVDLNKLIGKFDEDIENELIKLSSKLEIMDSTTVIENTIETNESTEIITTNKNNDEMKKEENYTLYIYIGIVLATVLFVFLIFEVSPSIKKVEFLCKIGLGKYALRISEKLVMKEPNNYKNYMAMAKAFEAIGEYNSSIVCYKKALKLKEKGEIK